MRVLLTAAAATDQRLDGITVFSESLASKLSVDGALREPPGVVSLSNHVNTCALFVSDLLNHPAEASLSDTRIGALRVFRAALPGPRTVEEALDVPGAAELFGQAVAAFAPDVVHFHALELLSADMIEVARRAGVPALLTLHDFYLICPAVRLLELGGAPCLGPERGERCGSCLAATGHLTGRYRGGLRWLARRWDVKVRRRYASAFRARFERLERLVRQLDAVVCPSRYLGDRVVSAGMLERYELISNGSDLVPLPVRRGDGPPVVGMMAHHSRAKGTSLLVEAMRIVPGLPLRVRVYGGGDPRYLAAVRRLARGDDRLSFEGPFAPGEVPDVLAQLDAVVVPSVFPENCPLVVQDALAAGRPCIVPSDTGAVEAVADGRHGFHFARGDAASLGDALRRLVEDRAVLVRFRDNILKDRLVISRAEACGRYAALYQRVLERRRVVSR